MHVDIHTHVIPPPYIEWLSQHGDRVGVKVIREQEGQLQIRTAFNTYTLDQRYHDLPRRLADMDCMSIDMQLVSLSMPLLPTGVTDTLACEMCRRQNEAVAEMVSAFPDRFVGAASVPLQAPESAARELMYANQTLGLRAVHICTNTEGYSLDWPAMEPFWASAAELQILVLVHPGGRVAGAERMKQYYLRNLIGLPTETALAIAALIFGGVLEEHPALRICFAHGGGFGPYGIARIDHGYQVRAECRDQIPQRPSEYLRHLYFDTVVHDTPHLSFLSDAVGADRLVLGSDYPADMGLRDPIREVLAVPELTKRQRNRILGATARELLRLDRMVGDEEQC